MEPRTSFLLAVLAALPPRFAFDEAALLNALQRYGVLDGERDGPFTSLRASELHDALIAAADAGMVREVEITPGAFLVVRLEREAPGSRVVPNEIRDLVAAVRERLRQPDGALLARAVEMPVETVALRRAILDPAQFTWSAQDYAMLLDAAGRAADERE
jgi:hypothetical protein